MPSISPRSYNKISPENLEELRQLWEEGCQTLDELASRFGMSRRGAQAALARIGAVKGSKPKPVAVISPPAAVPAATGASSHDEKANIARDTAWAFASELEALAMANARAMAAAGPSITAGRAIDLAASVVTRAKGLRWAVLGADGKLPLDAESLPELPIREMTPMEVDAIRAQQEAEARESLGFSDDDAYGGEEEENDIVEEGFDEPPPPVRLGGDDGPQARY